MILALSRDGNDKDVCNEYLQWTRVRYGAAAVPGDRRPYRRAGGRARQAAVPEARDHRLLPDPPGRRIHQGLSGLSRPASPDARADQGRHTILALRRYRRGGGAGDLDELEMCPGGVALRGGQRRGHGRSGGPVAAGAGGFVASLHAGDDPVRRTAYRCHGAGYGHQRAGDGVVHGHLLDAPGLDRDRNRDRQAGRHRRHGGTARGHRARHRAPSDRARPKRSA